jgi:ribosomal protein L35
MVDWQMSKAANSDGIPHSKAHYIINPCATRTCSSVGWWRTATRRQHVFIRFLLYRTSVNRVITSSLLLLSNTRVSEAQNTLWHEEEVARISLRRIQACEQRSICSSCRILTSSFFTAYSQAHSGHSHLNVSKRPGRKNHLSLTAYSSPSQTSKLKKLMPYS